jgi:hypothetical protein
MIGMGHLDAKCIAAELAKSAAKETELQSLKLNQVIVQEQVRRYKRITPFLVRLKHARALLRAKEADGRVVDRMNKRAEVKRVEAAKQERDRTYNTQQQILQLQALVAHSQVGRYSGSRSFRNRGRHGRSRLSNGMRAQSEGSPRRGNRPRNHQIMSDEEEEKEEDDGDQSTTTTASIIPSVKRMMLALHTPSNTTEPPPGYNIDEDPLQI